MRNTRVLIVYGGDRARTNIKYRLCRDLEINYSYGVADLLTALHDLCDPDRHFDIVICQYSVYNAIKKVRENGVELLDAVRQVGLYDGPFILVVDHAGQSCWAAQDVAVLGEAGREVLICLQEDLALMVAQALS